MVILIFTFMGETWNITKTFMFYNAVKVPTCHAMPCELSKCKLYATINLKQYMHYTCIPPLLTIILLASHRIIGKARRIHRRHEQILGGPRQIRTRMVLTVHPRPKRFIRRWIRILVPQRKNQHLLQCRGPVVSPRKRLQGKRCRHLMGGG